MCGWFATFAENQELLEEVLKLLKSKFELKVLGALKHFLEVNFEKVNGTLFIKRITL